MSLQCLPSSFGSIQFTVWEEMSFEEFQDGRHGGHLSYRNRTVLAILNLCRSDASHQVSAQSDMVLEEMSFEVFQDSRHGSHLGYRNGKILTILNLYPAVMPPIMFWLNLTYGLGKKKKKKNAAMAAILDIRTKRF